MELRCQLPKPRRRARDQGEKFANPMRRMTISLVVLWCILTAGPCTAQSSQTDNKLRSSSCPDPVALDLFKHQIAYQRTEEYDPLKGLQEIHADVWERGDLTVFYVRERLNQAVPTIRGAYVIGNHEVLPTYTCPVQQNWKECVEKNAGVVTLNPISRTCAIRLDMRAIPAWKPAPNDAAKQRIKDELRGEIEAKWPGVQEIVIRDFDLMDNDITMYLRMPDGDYYQGCRFHAMSEPHCDGWHLFGTAPVANIRKWIFEKPYKLK